MPHPLLIALAVVLLLQFTGRIDLRRILGRLAGPGPAAAPPSDESNDARDLMRRTADRRHRRKLDAIDAEIEEERQARYMESIGTAEPTPTGPDPVKLPATKPARKKKA